MRIYPIRTLLVLAASLLSSEPVAGQEPAELRGVQRLFECRGDYFAVGSNDFTTAQWPMLPDPGQIGSCNGLQRPPLAAKWDGLIDFAVEEETQGDTNVTVDIPLEVEGPGNVTSVAVDIKIYAYSTEAPDMWLIHPDGTEAFFYNWECERVPLALGYRGYPGDPAIDIENSFSQANRRSAWYSFGTDGLAGGSSGEVTREDGSVLTKIEGPVSSVCYALFAGPSLPTTSHQYGDPKWQGLVQAISFMSGSWQTLPNLYSYGGNPGGLFTVFNGKPKAGTWTLRIQGFGIAPLFNIFGTEIEFDRQLPFVDGARLRIRTDLDPEPPIVPSPFDAILDGGPVQIPTMSHIALLLLSLAGLIMGGYMLRRGP